MTAVTVAVWPRDCGVNGSISGDDHVDGGGGGDHSDCGSVAGVDFGDGDGRG